MAIINVTANESFVDRDGFDHLETVARMVEVDTTERFGWNVEYPNVKAAIEGFGTGVDMSVPSVSLLSRYGASDYLVDLAKKACAIVPQYPELYFQSMSDNLASKCRTITVSDADIKLDNLLKQAREMKAYMDRPIIVCPDSNVLTWESEYKAFMDAYQKLNQAEYKDAADNLKPNGVIAITQWGYRWAMDRMSEIVGQIVKIRENRLIVVKHFISVTKQGEQRISGYRVFDTHKLEYHNIKTKQAGSETIATRGYNYKALLEHFVKPYVQAYQHRNHSHIDYDLNFITTKRTQVRDTLKSADN